MSKILATCPIAAHASVNAIATDATLNVARIAVGQRSAVRTSTRMMRGGRRGTASGPARRIASGWISSSTAIQTFPICDGAADVLSTFALRKFRGWLPRTVSPENAIQFILRLCLLLWRWLSTRWDKADLPRPTCARVQNKKGDVGVRLGRFQTNFIQNRLPQWPARRLSH
jgi:hypothetical protein